MKLRGRTTTPDRRRGRTLSPGARGAKQTTPHGPLQRLLEVALMVLRDVVAAVVTSPRNPEWSPRQSGVNEWLSAARAHRNPVIEGHRRYGRGRDQGHADAQNCGGDNRRTNEGGKEVCHDANGPHKAQQDPRGEIGHAPEQPQTPGGASQNHSVSLNHATSNGEAERPHAGAGSEPWAHNVFPRPRRYY